VNIVFDFGGVVFSWEPAAVAAKVFPDAKDQKLAIDKIFAHDDWLALDKGTLTRNEAIKRATARTGLDISKVDALIRLVPSMLLPIQGTVSLLQRLKEKGHKLFVLSNMHKDSIEYLESTNTFLTIFDGMVISCRLNMIKPEQQIFHYLLDIYHLIPSETVFIDDMEINTIAASKLGIITIKFENPSQCESQLKAIGCL
jgi:epoxide hydrolase-like predicted phosphatase